MQYEDASTKLSKNGMDLPNPVKSYHKGIRFKISELFSDGYDKNFVLKDDALTKAIYEIGLNFSVESFSKSEAAVFQYAFTEQRDPLNAVHDQYIVKRQNSLHDQYTSIKKAVPTTVGFDGIIQIIQGSRYDKETASSYFMATLQIGENYYVFQLIGKKENMVYLYDDFIEILKSVEK